MEQEKEINLQGISGIRIDKFISDNSDLSRNKVNELIEEKRVFLNGSNEFKKRFILLGGEEIQVFVDKQKECEVVPMDVPINIVYEDDDVIVVNKQRGLVVHPSPGHYEDTLVNGLMFLNKELGDNGDSFRPGIVHRIDKDTSGLLVIGKNEKAIRSLGEQFKEHSVKREYRALVAGIFEEESGEIELPIGRDDKFRLKMAVKENGKYAKTYYWVLKTFKTHSYLKLQLETGRTHQIRVHMSYINHPVAGDPLYGRNSSLISRVGQVLHAKTLGFVHPTTGEFLEFDSELPEYFQELLDKLGE